RTLAALAALALAALIVGAVVGAAWGWAFAALAVSALLAYHIIHLARLARWLAEPLPGKVPEGRGTWDEVLTALHRYERAGAAREQQLAGALTQFRRAAQAMPELDPRTDVGRPIANLVREPDFIDYLAAEGEERARPVRLEVAHGRVAAIQLIPYGESQTLLLARDITQAERVETMRRDFVANVSHELRTPLTVLVGFLETVRELKLDPQRVRDYIGMMR